MGNQFGDNLYKYRSQSNLSQKDVSEELGIAQSTYSLYENGEREPNLAKIKKIAELYMVSIDELFGFNSKKDDYSVLFEKLDDKDKKEVMAIINQMLTNEKYAK
ncbi:MAG: helix-turn-helix transcriptional regulator [Clostridia bacterium]|nr:helix-turn-helix transcriptional regulator [Clostridia bacterium]